MKRIRFSFDFKQAASVTLSAFDPRNQDRELQLFFQLEL